MLPRQQRPRRSHLSTAFVTVLGTMTAALITAAPAVADPEPRPVEASAPTQRVAPAPQRLITYAQWDSGAELRRGARSGVRVGAGQLRLAGKGTVKRTFQGRRYDAGGWRTGWVRPGYALTELIPSWSATTPRDSWVEVSVRAKSGSRTGSWDVMGRWASGDRFLKRHTGSSQGDDLGRANVDTWVTPGATAYQVRVLLMRRAGASYTPTVDSVGAVASRLPSGTPSTSKPGGARGTVLNVPAYSQMTHSGHFRQWGGGGQAWCSPTAVSMVLGYYRSLPAASAYSWVGAGHTDPWVDYGARATYDYAYKGAGNWAFNSAYAATRVGTSFITRLRSLREAERFIQAGIPVVASISFSSGGLPGAPISSTTGHLVVIVGFDKAGDVVVNDPASSSRSGVRRTYDRAAFERAWLPTSGGLSYVIRPASRPLPAGTASNW